jgi:hypothetical protein
MDIWCEGIYTMCKLMLCVMSWMQMITCNEIQLALFILNIVQNYYKLIVLSFFQCLAITWVMQHRVVTKVCLAFRCFAHNMDCTYSYTLTHLMLVVWLILGPFIWGMPPPWDCTILCKTMAMHKKTSQWNWLGENSKKTPHFGG